MSIKISEFNAFDYIDNQDDLFTFLEECMLDDDPNTFVEAIGLLVKKRGVSHVAKSAGLSRESLYKVINGKSKPRWETVIKIIRTLDIKLLPKMV